MINEPNNNNQETELTEEEILYYMEEAMTECGKALELGEVPVGCVFLHMKSKKIIVRGHNLTNKTKNATTHAEINCINSIYKILSDQIEKQDFIEKCNIEGDANKVFSDCVLFVSCEPCIMCAYALSLIRIRKVYFGCENDKFGGNGSILSLHCVPDYKYPSFGGYLKDKAIEYFRKFYVRGNIKAPDHKRQRKLVLDN